MTYNEESKNEILCADNTLARSQQNEEEMQEIVDNMEAQSVSEEDLELDDRHCPTCKCNDDERDINYHFPIDGTYKIRHCPNCDARVWCQECCSEL